MKRWNEFLNALTASDTLSGSEILPLSQTSQDRYTTPMLMRNFVMRGLPIITVGVAGSIADYVCDGINDEATIKLAVNAVDSLGGGQVLLLAGTYIEDTSCTFASLTSYNNIWIRGAGMGITTLKANKNGITQLGFGDGNGTSGKESNNIIISDLTIDMNNKTGAAYGITMHTKTSIVERVQFINRGNPAKNMLYCGVSSNATTDFAVSDFIIDQCRFENSSGTFESLILAQTQDVRITNCYFGEKASGYNLLNYGSYKVSVTNCTFEDCSNGTNGIGDTKFSNCNFIRASVKVQGYNTHFDTCMFDGGENYDLTYVQILGFVQSAGESGIGAPPAGTDVQIINTKIYNCIFKRANIQAISAATFTGNASSPVLSASSLFISNCRFENSYWQAMDVKADYLVITDNDSCNNGQLGTSPVKYNYVFAGKRVYFARNRSYDDQGTPTITTDFFIDNQYSASALATMDVTIEDNHFTIGASSGTLPRYYTGSTFTSTKPSNITIHGKNNTKINPTLQFDHGNVTGSKTFTRVDGDVQTLTATGNITTTITNGVIPGDTLTLIVTQDATGSRTISKPSNVKLVGGAFSPTAAANAVDSWTLVWDGTDWREVSRSLNQS